MQYFACLRRRDASVDAQAIEVVEAEERGPGWKALFALLHKGFLKIGDRLGSAGIA